MDPELDLLIERLEKALARLPSTATAEQLARATYNVLRTTAKDTGQKPDIETALWAPGSRKGLDHWRANWEAGPYEWAVSASALYSRFGNHIVEPYYSFDLCFYPHQD